MDSEIKQRIEMVRRGEVPEGYKKIQRDIIPKDWTIKSLAEVGNNFSYGMNAAAKAYDGHNKYIRITDIDDNTHIYTGLDLVSPHADLELKYRVQENDILFARTGATVGKTYLYNKNDGILFFAGFLIRVNIPIDNSYYVYEQTLTGRYLNWIRIMSQRSGQPGINAQEYGTYSFPYCCVKEQQKIATILTTQDKVIELKEKRLAEKQRQKMYLMQQLLTGKKRLPGYWGEWNFPKAKEVFQSVTDKNHKGDLMVLSATQDKGIMPRDEVDIDIKYEVSSLANYKKVCQGNFVISLRSFQGGIEYSAYTGLVSPAYTVLSSKKELCDEYYKQYFKSADFINRLNVAVYGIRDGKQISFEEFGRLRIPYPPINEQSAIAQVLSTADREISLL